MSPELSICENDSALVSAISSGTGTISWYNSPTSTTSIATGTTISTPTLSAGSYTYYAEDASCASGQKTQVVIVVNSYPSISASTNISLICTGQSATLSASGASSYTWNTSANGFSIAVSPTINTNYWVVAENGGCVDTAYVTQSVSSCTGVEELNTSSFSIYPNPNDGSFFVTSEMENELIIFNGFSERVSELKLNVCQNKIDIANLPKGIYYYKITNPKGLNYSGKIIVN
jgi:hypothetical protein